MRLCSVFTLCLLLVGTQAGFFDGVKDTFDKIGDGLKQTAEAFVPYAKNVGDQLLDQMKTGGASVLSKTLTDLVVGGFSSLFGRRGVSGIEEKVKSELSNFFGDSVEKFKPFFKAVMDSMQALHDKVASLDFSPEKVLKAINSLVVAHNEVADTWLHNLIEDGKNLVAKLISNHKRADLSSTLASVGQSISNFFTPAVNAVKGLVSQAGAVLKNAVSGLGDKLQPHVDALKQHTSTLIHHGVNALGALSNAAADIFQQTMKDAAPAIHQVGSTILDASKVTAQHLAGKLGGAASTQE